MRNFGRFSFYVWNNCNICVTSVSLLSLCGRCYYHYKKQKNNRKLILWYILEYINSLLLDGFNNFNLSHLRTWNGKQTELTPNSHSGFPYSIHGPEKYGLGKLQIRPLFTHCILSICFRSINIKETFTISWNPILLQITETWIQKWTM